MENDKFIKEQIITYLGNKRKLLDYISTEVEDILKELNQEKAIICDLFSGSGVVARKLKKFSKVLYVNDLEKYSCIINSCYLTNKNEFNDQLYDEYLKKILDYKPVCGVITENYAPQNDDDIKEGERVFYTHENAIIIDTIRTAIDNVVPENYRKFFIAPLLYEASVHTNTSGVFKGFYKSKKNNIGKFGGDGENSLDRICGKIYLRKPVFSNYISDVIVCNKDANDLVKELHGLDITYIDPPYNQHPYGSNYFMLNTIVENRLGENISKVAGIPIDWNKSVYNKKSLALASLENLISDVDSKYIIISYNNEGFININDMINMLSKYGELTIRDIDYITFRGSRNLNSRNTHTIEYLFVLKKKIKGGR